MGAITTRRAMLTTPALATPAQTTRALATLMLVMSSTLLLAGCAPAPSPAASAAPSSSAGLPPHGLRGGDAHAAPAPAWVAAARAQVGVTVRYDPAYAVLAYPAGDVPSDRGVCTDVVIRALRGSGLDLQQRVHEDMREHFARYPQAWGLRAPDRNIDHRRVPNLQRWFERQHWERRPGIEAGDYLPGDLVTWTVDGRLPHIGIVSDRRAADGTPLVIHNIGAGTREENRLFAYPITGQYRPALADQSAASGASDASAMRE